MGGPVGPVTDLERIAAVLALANAGFRSTLYSLEVSTELWRTREARASRFEATVGPVTACPEGGVVLDPFAGSGTTLHTARRLGRRAIGIELNPEYARLAAERLQQLSLLGGAAGVPAPLGDISHEEVSVVGGRSGTNETLVPKRVLGQDVEGPGMGGNARNTRVSGGNVSGGGGQSRSESFRDRERVLAQRTRQAFQQQRFVRRAVGW